MDDTLREDTLAAIALVTAANSDRSLASHLATEYASEHPDGHSRIANGLITLSEVLLAKIRLETDASVDQTLFWAADFVNNWEGDF